jgi:hypothetical protein
MSTTGTIVSGAYISGGRTAREEAVFGEDGYGVEDEDYG